MRALSDAERASFRAIREHPDIMLVQTEFGGEDTAVIAHVRRDGDVREVRPLAVLVTGRIAARLADPNREGGVEAQGGPLPAYRDLLDLAENLAYLLMAGEADGDGDPVRPEDADSVVGHLRSLARSLVRWAAGANGKVGP